MIKDFIKIPFREIQRRKLRSGLTLLGIIIGIAAVTSLILLGQGLENAITEQFSILGNDKIFLIPKGNSLTPGISIDAVKITEDDLEVVRKTQGVKLATGFLASTAKIEFNDQARWFIVFGQSPEFEERELFGESQSYKIVKGRPMEKNDKYKVTIGHDYRTSSLFGKAVDLGDKITIHGQKFEVVGFLGKIGSPPDDRSIGINIDIYQELFEKNEELGTIIAQVQAGENVAAVTDNVFKELRKHRNVKEGEEDFTIQTPEQLLATFSIILNIVQIVVGGIAGISLLVGGVNIMNTMYTSVLQRRKQIGVMKAIGGRRKDILLLFLIESGLYGLIGGLIGLVIGVSVAKFIEYLFTVFIGPAFLSVIVNPSFLGITLLFSFVVGILSGVTPAWQAASLKPIDALRYE